MKFSFVHAEKACFPVATLCRVLGVSRQGYYAFAAREPSPRERSDAALQQRVREVHAESRGTYGSPRILHALRSSGFSVGKRRVERTMRSLGLAARQKPRFRTTTAANPLHRVEPNVLARDFTATRPNEHWVTDITYVWTDEGW